jgi:uncharacterized protein
MTLFFALLPLYLFGNFHCLGMCGPLVMMIGRHRYRNLYFLGRLLSFSLTGMVAGEIGAVLQIVLKGWHLPEALSFIFGSFLIYLGLSTFYGWTPPSMPRLAKANRMISELILKDRRSTTFLFGFLTVALPCGQTLVVFSACAIAGSAWVGLFNGFAFALLTSPSLYFAMHAHQFFKGMNRYYSSVLAISSLIVGVIAFGRGFAELGWIPHLTITPFELENFHLVIF